MPFFDILAYAVVVFDSRVGKTDDSRTGSAEGFDSRAAYAEYPVNVFFGQTDKGGGGFQAAFDTSGGDKGKSVFVKTDVIVNRRRPALAGRDAKIGL